MKGAYLSGRKEGRCRSRMGHAISLGFLFFSLHGELFEDDIPRPPISVGLFRVTMKYRLFHSLGREEGKLD